MQYADAFKYKKWANTELLLLGERQIHLLPESDKNYFIRILNHTTIVDSLFISRISGIKEEFEGDNTIETPSIWELINKVEKNDSWLVSFSESVSSKELDRKISFRFTDGDFGQLSVDEIFIHLLTHGSNHRGMASRVLASNELERPKDTFTRFLHELEPLRRSVDENLCS